ncbi:MAG: glycosyltransferase family 2 protein [Verrucomicrobia bacterium]|nr:glycosyltransferase family 2 protein [Verrucomicrobiota bacterium]
MAKRPYARPMNPAGRVRPGEPLDVRGTRPNRLAGDSLALPTSSREDDGSSLSTSTAMSAPPRSGHHPEASGPAASNSICCSVVLAARNEEARIEQTIRHLLAQHGVELEVIAVDDRSTDRTNEILRRLADQDSRVRVLRVDALPEGWLGKCHACHVGAGAATGDWILFTDPDCWLKPDVLARALRVANREKAGHVTLIPGVAPETVGGQAWHLAFLLSVVDWISRVNHDRPKAYLGMGAFNLIRADVYRACGGYEALRLTVLDDVRLGLLVRRAGKPTRAFIGGDDAECHWGATALGMIKIMEKNYFAALDYRTLPALVLGVFGPAAWAAAAIGPLTGTLPGLAAGLALASLIWPAANLARRLGWGFGGAVLTPFMVPVLFYAMLNSAVVTLRQGGIRWRETFYPLHVLKAGGVR